MSSHKYWPFVSKPLLAAKAQSKKKKIAQIKDMVVKMSKQPLKTLPHYAWSIRRQFSDLANRVWA